MQPGAVGNEGDGRDYRKVRLRAVRDPNTPPGPELEGLFRELGSEEETGFGLIARAANTFLAKADRERSGVLSAAQP